MAIEIGDAFAAHPIGRSHFAVGVEQHRDLQALSESDLADRLAGLHFHPHASLSMKRLRLRDGVLVVDHRLVLRRRLIRNETQ